MQTNPPDNKWHTERISDDEVHHHRISQVLVETETDFQKMRVVDLEAFGRALVLDSKVQSTLGDEFIYHESLVQPAMVAATNPTSVLVIGGGEGATIREILRWPTVATVTMVDIDRQVVDACREHLREFHEGAFDDPRLKIVIEDARAFVEKTEAKFDVVIVDISEPLECNSASLMFTSEFYGRIQEILTDNGTLAVQSGSTHINELPFFTGLVNTIQSVFPLAAPYAAFVPSFVTRWGFTLALKGENRSLPGAEEVDEVLKGFNINEALRFYDGTAHISCFNLPKYVRAALAEDKRVYADDNPPVVYG